MKRLFLILSILLLAGCTSDIECKTNEDCIPDNAKVGLRYLCEENKCVQKAFGNPASTYCIDEGGQLQMVEDELGVHGICMFNDGSQCEEWEFFKQICNKGDNFP